MKNGDEDAISDEDDLDYSSLKLDFVDVDSAKGDCLDFSFGKYEIENGNLNCADRSVSVGETSNLKVHKLNVLNSNIGIASKDNSRVDIDNITLRNLEY